MESQPSDLPQPLKKPAEKSRVLILDDDSSLCNMLQDIIEEYDFQTVTTETKEEAIKATREFKPHIALVDYKLGNITGIEVAHELKKIDIDLPCILMTAYPSLDLAIKAIQSDIYDFLSKPVDTTYLLRSINKALEKRLLSEENRQLIASLKESNAKLDRLSQMKSKFLSVVTHDLRTPLTSIRGYSEFLRMDENLSAEDKNRCLDSIERSSERMNYLIGSLMDMISIEAGKLRVELTDINYAAMLKELKVSLAPIVEPKKIALQWEFSETPVQIKGDYNRLLQVVTNLVSNAVKHTPEKGSIKVKCALKDGPADPNVGISGKRILTEVIDNGAGIAHEHLTRIFDQFYQVESSPTRKQGLGLGLNIAKEIIEAHHGKINVTSEGPGKGSIFYFSIPIAK